MQSLLHVGSKITLYILFMVITFGMHVHLHVLKTIVQVGILVNLF